MRATPRITWLLFLSSLFHSICSGENTTDPPLHNATSASAAVSSAAPESTKEALTTTVTMAIQTPADIVDTVTVTKLGVTTQSVTDIQPVTSGGAAVHPGVTSGLSNTGAASTQPLRTSPSVQTTSQQERMTTGPSKTPTETSGVTRGFNTKTPTVIATSLRPEDSNHSTQNQTEGSRATDSAATVAITAAPSEAPPPPVTTPSTTPSLAKTEPTQTEASHTRAKTEPLPSGSPSTTAPAQSHTFNFPPPSGQLETKEQKILGEVCKRLFPDWRSGTCMFEWRQQNGGVLFDKINISVNSSLAANYYEEITKPTDNKTLIAILASCGSLLIMIIILAVCASHHRRPYSENQQHLTEELQAVENGYHDNPTLEVMEVQPEMQEKKVALNGEFNDSWIVPIDNLLKEIPDEEDTHL